MSVDEQCYNLIADAGLEPILQGGRGQASGFIMRMMAENKKKHQGQYKNPSGNDYNSTMKSFVPFDYKKLANADQKGSNTKDYGASPFIMKHFGSPEAVPFVPKAERTGRDITKPEEGETDEQRAARLQTKAEELAKLAKDLLESAPKRRKVSEFLTAKVKAIKEKKKASQMDDYFELPLRITEIPADIRTTKGIYGEVGYDDVAFVKENRQRINKEDLNADKLINSLVDFHRSKRGEFYPERDRDAIVNRFFEVTRPNKFGINYNEWLKSPFAKKIVREMREKYKEHRAEKNAEIDKKWRKMYEDEREQYKKKQQWEDEFEELREWEATITSRKDKDDGEKWRKYLIEHYNGKTATSTQSKNYPFDYKPLPAQSPYVQYAARPASVEADLLAEEQRKKKRQADWKTESDELDAVLELIRKKELDFTRPQLAAVERWRKYLEEAYNPTRPYVQYSHRPYGLDFRPKSKLSRDDLKEKPTQELRDMLFRAQGRPERVGLKSTGSFGTRDKIIDEIIRLKGAA